MAGNPKRRAMVAELKRRAAEEHEGDVLAYVKDWVASGRSVTKLAIDISTSLKFDVSRSFVATYINGLTETARAELEVARAEGAHAILEHAQIRTEDVSADRDDIARAKLQNDVDFFIVERWNKAELGQAKAGVSLQLNIGTLMLEALQAPIPVPIAIASAIAEEAEVVSIEESTT